MVCLADGVLVEYLGCGMTSLLIGGMSGWWYVFFAGWWYVWLIVCMASGMTCLLAGGTDGWRYSLLSC